MHPVAREAPLAFDLAYELEPVRVDVDPHFFAEFAKGGGSVTLAALQPAARKGFAFLVRIADQEQLIVVPDRYVGSV